MFASTLFFFLLRILFTWEVKCRQCGLDGGLASGYSSWIHILSLRLRLGCCKVKYMFGLAFGRAKSIFKGIELIMEWF